MPESHRYLTREKRCQIPATGKAVFRIWQSPGGRSMIGRRFGAEVPAERDGPPCGHRRGIENWADPITYPRPSPPGALRCPENADTLPYEGTPVVPRPESPVSGSQESSRCCTSKEWK